MATSPRSPLGASLDIAGYAALVLIAVVAGFLYFSDTTESVALPPRPLPPVVAVPPESRLDRLTRQARAGDVMSQQQLGQVYYMGMDVTRDYAEGVRWLKMAAERGDAVAARLMGFAYRFGNGVVADEAQAVSWWRLAASKGDDVASFEMAKAYLDGRGVAESKADALGYCRSAADMGYQHAQLYLGYWYLKGVIVAQSNSDAFLWLRKSAVQGNSEAQNYLGTMYRDGLSVPPSDSEAIRWFRFAVDHHSGPGCVSLAWMFSQGRGGSKDETQANALLLKGAMLGYDSAQAELARRYVAGVGLSADSVEGCAWYDVAARGGDSDATIARDGLLKVLSSAQVSAMRVRSDALIAQIKAERTSRRRP